MMSDEIKLTDPAVATIDSSGRLLLKCSECDKEWSGAFVYKCDYDKLQVENAKLRAREINGTLRTYDGEVQRLEAELKECENDYEWALNRIDEMKARIAQLEETLGYYCDCTGGIKCEACVVLKRDHHT